MAVVWPRSITGVVAGDQFTAAVMRIAGISLALRTHRGLCLVILQRENHALMGWRRLG